MLKDLKMLRRLLFFKLSLQKRNLNDFSSLFVNQHTFMVFLCMKLSNWIDFELIHGISFIFAPLSIVDKSIPIYASKL